MVCSFFENKKILVTGGSGFVGSHLCEALALVCDVWSVDNYSTGSINNHIAGVKYYRANTTEIDHLDIPVPDIVFHLGEYSRVEQSFVDLEQVWNSNVYGTSAVLNYCKKTGAKLIYAGSSTKFGDNGLGRNQSPYGWTKSSNTDLISNFGAWFGLSHAIVYFYNAYGPREIRIGKYATLIGRYAELMRQGKPLGVVLPGSQVRNFTHVADLVSGLLLVAEFGSGDGYGIGSDESFSVFDVAQLFGGDVEMLPERKGNRMSANLVVDKTKALGWSATHTLTGYIERLKETNWSHE